MLKYPAKFALLALLAAATPAAADAPAAVSELRGFHAEYVARYAGFSAAASIDLRPTATADEYVYEIITKARGLARLIRPGTGVETSWFFFNENGFRPVAYKLEGGTGDNENDTTISFDWDAMTAASVYEDEPKEIELNPGVLDRMTADVVAIYALRNGAEPGVHSIVHRNSIREYGFEYLGEETVKVPAGEFAAVKYIRQRPESSRATVIWYAPDVDYLPVRIQQLKRGKSRILMEATKLQSAQP